MEEASNTPRELAAAALRCPDAPAVRAVLH